MKFAFLPAAVLAAALSLPAGAAQAQSKFSLTIGGDAFFEAGYVDQKRDDGLRSTEFRNRFRLLVTGLAKADNGLEYGARARLRASSGDRLMDADRAFLFAQGSFGTLRGGQLSGIDNDVHLSMQTPLDWRMLVLYNEPYAYIGSSAAGGATINGLPAGADVPLSKTGFDWIDLNYLENSATKIVYYSPRIAGFQVGFDYTPRNDSSNTDINRAKLATGTAAFTNTYQDILEVGANYNAKLGEVGLKAFGAAMTGNAVDTPAASYRDLRAWHVGGQVGLGAWSVGAGYLDVGKSGLSKASAATERTRNWSTGVQYKEGELAAGVQYQYGQDAGNPLIAGKRSADTYTAGLMYTLAPGLQVGGEYTFFRSKSDVSVRNDRGSAVLLHSALTF